MKHKAFIEKCYDLQITGIQQVQGGWAALAYRIHSNKGDFFLKAFDKHRHTAQEWIQKIDEYMPILMTLGENNRLNGKISVPILTINGSYKVENEDCVFIVFPFVEGETPGSEKLSVYEQECLAEIIAELHSYKESNFLYYKN